MIVKVCGMREPENIRDVAALGVDWIGFIFYPKSPRYVSQIRSRAGIIPDYSVFMKHEELSSKELSSKELSNKEVSNKEVMRQVKRVGVFVDDMPQNIVTRAVNYELDIIQLHGSESVIMIDNLRSTLAPSIRKGIKFMKALSISTAEDILRYKEYEGHVDYFIFDTQTPLIGGSGNHFDWNMLDAYDGNTPFILSGGVGPDDAERVLSIRHPMFAGIDLNSQFETAPAVKNVDALKAFLAKIR
ncbi:MAG: phosphoribosylanthranilate isomerase [Prevotella sp.]|nr:phosphoribosylanthranilate isomerase [Prevotella sp.]